MNRIANMSTDGGSTWLSVGGWFVDGLINPLAPTGWQGSYDGIEASPWVASTFILGWADPRVVPAFPVVHGAAMYP